MKNSTITILLLLVTSISSFGQTKDFVTASKYIERHFGSEYSESIVSVERGSIPYNVNTVVSLRLLAREAKEYGDNSFEYEMQKDFRSQMLRNASLNNVEALTPIVNEIIELYINPLYIYKDYGVVPNRTNHDYGNQLYETYDVKIVINGVNEHVGLIMSKENKRIITSTKHILFELNFYANQINN